MRLLGMSRPVGRHRKPPALEPQHRTSHRRSRGKAPMAAVVLAASVFQGVASAADAPTGVRSARVVRSVSFNQASAATTLVSGAISTTAPNQLIVAFLASHGPAGQRQAFRSVQGCGLRWSLVRRANGMSGTSEIWKARAANRLSRCAVRAVRRLGSYQGSSTLVSFDRAIVVNSSARSSAVDNPKVRISGRRGSLLYGIGNDSGAAAVRSMPPGQTLIQEFSARNGKAMWVQRAVRPKPRTATVTLGARDPKNKQWNFAAVEIRAFSTRAVKLGTVTPGPRPTETGPVVNPAAAPTVGPGGPVAGVTPPTPGAPVAGVTPAPVAPPAPVASPTKAPAPVASPTKAPAPVASPTKAPAPPAPAPPPPAPPANGAFPGSGNTGVPAGTTLTPSGALTVSTAGTVLDALEITGGVIILAPNVVISRSRIRGTATDNYGVYVKSGSVTITDTEIVGFENGVAFKNWSCTRCNIHGQSQDGVKLGSNVTLQASYIHDLLPEANAHADGAQMQGAEANVYVLGNHIESSNSRTMGNAAIIMKADFGVAGYGPVVIEGNLLGGGNYTLFLIAVAGAPQSGVRIDNNRFKRNSRYGAAHTTSPFTQSGNVWDDTGQPLVL